MNPRRIALMGGSYNPVHIGHMMVADYVRRHTDIDCVHMMLSPLNPLKVSAGDLIDDADRMAMLRIACSSVEGVEADDMELSMPRPSYTIDTLRRMQVEHPDARITLVIGSDNWLEWPRWRAHDEIVAQYDIIVYPRPGYPIDRSTLPESVQVVDAPVADLSSTQLRRFIAEGYDVNIYLPTGVDEYIKQHNLYKQC